MSDAVYGKLRSVHAVLDITGYNRWRSFSISAMSKEDCNLVYEISIVVYMKKSVEENKLSGCK